MKLQEILIPPRKKRADNQLFGQNFHYLVENDKISSAMSQNSYIVRKNKYYTLSKYSENIEL